MPCWLLFEIWLLVIVALLSVIAGAVGIGAAWVNYRRPREDWERWEHGIQPAWGWWEQAYNVDAFYGEIIVAPGKRVAELAAFSIDIPIIDGAVNGVARLVRGVGDWIRPLQTGYVRNYGALLLTGAVAIVIWLLVGGT